jgi:hypothetical protein
MESSTGSRFIGIDAGTETLKLVEVLSGEGGWRVGRREVLEHGKSPASALMDMLRRRDWHAAAGSAITGRFSSQIQLPRIPVKHAQLRGCRFLCGEDPITVINIGSHGPSLLELRANGTAVFRENNRCSQGMVYNTCIVLFMVLASIQDDNVDSPVCSIFGGWEIGILKRIIFRPRGSSEARTKVFADCLALGLALGILREETCAIIAPFFFSS